MAKTASKKTSSAKGSKKSSPFKAVKGFMQVQRARWKEFRKDKVKLHKKVFVVPIEKIILEKLKLRVYSRMR